MNTNRITICTLAVVVALSCMAQAHAEMSWNRAADWTSAGATGNNPDGPWSYRSIQVEDAGGDVAPWYAGATTDDTWAFTSGPVYHGYWVNTSPAPWVNWTWIAQIHQTYLQSNWNTHATYLPYWVVPAVEWTNPTDADMDINIGGSVDLIWTNAAGTNGYSGKTLNAAIMKRTSGGLIMLQDLTSVKPTPGWVVDVLNIAVDIDTTIGADESIMIALMGIDGQNDYRGQLDDSGLAITEVPEPATLMLLGLGGLMLARRRG